MSGGTVWAVDFWAPDFWADGFWAGVAAPSAPVVPPSGGFTHFFDRIRDEEDERKRELEQIENAVDREIAQLVHKDDFKEKIKESLNDDRIKQAKEISENVAKAFVRAAVQGNFSALEAFNREMQQVKDEEDFLFLVLTMLE